MTTGQLAEICRALAPSAPPISSVVERTDFDALIQMTSAAHPGRRATVVTSVTGWIELSIDGGFGVLRMDEDATYEEFREYVADYVQLAVNYLRHGAEEKLTGLLRVPSRVLDPDRGEAGVARMNSADEVRYVWRRLWRMH